MKNLIFKFSFVIIVYVLLTYFYNVIKPMVITDSAMLQLEDSDAAYAEFQTIQSLFKFYWVLYIIPLIVFFKK